MIIKKQEVENKMKVYLIGGKARHGKDTVADFLQKFYEEKGLKVARSQISKYLKSYAKDYFGWDGSEANKPRELLQELGTDIIRIKLNKNTFFINRTIEDIEIMSNFFDCMIISDIRYPEEFDLIKERFPEETVKIKIKRINFEGALSEKQSQHLTELALDNYDKEDYLIINDTLEGLEKDVHDIFIKEISNEKND